MRPDDRLLRTLLQAAEQEREPGAHVSEEALALIARGSLNEPERGTVVKHLADCPDCRATFAGLLELREELVLIPAPPGRRARASRSVPWTMMATSAMVLVTAGIWFAASRSDPLLAEREVYLETRELLASSDFQQAQGVLARAASQGLSSDRLLNLKSQAARKIPSEIALASAGRLTDLGYEPGGILARGPRSATGLTEAGELLASAGDAEFAVVLNRGHVHLFSGEAEQAAAAFARARTMKPESPLAWLGTGLSAFVGGELEFAEQAFRRVLKLDSDNLDARVNLALTLEEQGRLADALLVWQSLENEPLSPGDRNLTRSAIELLESMLDE